MRPSDQPESPRLTANPISCILFSWVLPLFLKGYRKDLELDDIYRTLPDDETKRITDRVEAAWFEQISKTEVIRQKRKYAKNEGPTPSLVKALMKVFGPSTIAHSLFALFDDCGIKIAQPIIFGYLLDYFRTPEEFQTYQGYLLALAFVSCQILYVTIDHPFTFAAQHYGMKMRISLCSLIYRKSLRVSKQALEQTTVGQVVNVLSGDMNRFDIFFTFCHYIWVAPIQLIAVMCTLYFYVDLRYASLTGLVLIVFFVPFQGYMGVLFGKLRGETASKTDQRLVVLEEILSAMKVIKMYTWERHFSQSVSETRREEVKKLRKTAMCRALNQSFFSVTSRTTLFLTLLTYVLSGHIVTAKKVYMTLCFYQTVQYIMTMFFPLAIISLAETLVALDRIKSFLMLEEINIPLSALKDSNIERVRKYDWSVVSQEEYSINSEYTYTQTSFGSTVSTMAEIGIWVDNITARWSSTTEDMCFSNVSFEVKAGEILAVIGPTASGKSSILNALLYELPLKSGQFRAVGKIGLSCQEPWVFNSSVRENILFGKPYNSEWYDEVAEACALTKDFHLLAYGDRTIVGEKGAALSGGQKARVTLARAVYADADVYLLDDILSAVDAEVGHHIMEKCIMGLLKNKSRIFVTNQLQHVKHCDQILLMIDGIVEYKGGYKSLQSSGIPFSELLNPTHELLGIPGKNKHDEISINSGHHSSAAGLAITDKAPLMDVPNVPTKVGDTALEETEVEETVTTGSVGFSTYYSYFHAGSSLFKLIVFLILTIFTQCLFTGTDLYLEFWIDSIEKRAKGLSTNPFVRYFQTHFLLRVAIYSGIIFTLFTTSLIRTQTFYRICLRSSVVIYDRLFNSVLRSPMSFFDSTPVGRILNRFAKDVSIVDESLQQSLYDCLDTFMQTMGVMVLIIYNSSIMLAPSVALLGFFYGLRKFYFRTAQNIKRLEGTARSPIFSHLSTTINGLTTIRAFNMEEKFIREFESIHDIHNSVWYMFLSGNRWLGITVDWITVLFMGGLSLNFLLTHETVGDAVVGVSLTSAMMLTSMVQWGMRQSAEMETHLISFERVQEYCDLRPEAGLETAPENKPPATWPHKGEIKMQNLCLRYREDSPAMVLRNLNCNIIGGEKVGIVGRTGAGKSSMIAVLFRLAEPCSGYIEIDGIETTSLGLYDLRSKISIIPQEPVIFMGSIRNNLDPYSEYSDNEIWNSLREVKLMETVKFMDGGLDAEIHEGGTNFSSGQKQLFCLARAILKNNRILFMDEATASIDPETDRLIQRTIRKNFADCTVLTIAHRLHTVMDSDRILVLNAGQIMEFDEPQILLSNRNSMLYQLVQQTGKAEASNLAQIAEHAAFHRRKITSANASNVDARTSRSSPASCTNTTIDDLII